MKGNTPITHVMTYLYTDSEGKRVTFDQVGIGKGTKNSITNQKTNKTYSISSYYKFTYD